MRALVICPADRPAVGFLARKRPLALAPILGRSLLDLWLAELASRGATQVRILAADRPDEIRRAVGRGEAWGLRVDVLPEQRESAPGDARLRQAEFLRDGALAAPHDVVTLDRLPNGDAPLWGETAQWFAALRGECESAARERVGMREPSPGVYLHAQARVSSSARLVAPCWIGARAWIGPLATVGPGSIVEATAFVDARAEIVDSFVGPATYVGSMANLRDSLAWGGGLWRHTTGSFTEITDAFLLGDLGSRAGRPGLRAWPVRLLALLALALTSPVLLVAWFRRAPNSPLFVSRRAVRTPTADAELAGSQTYHELNGVGGLWRRWPRLWTIAHGGFAWVGNPTLTPEEARTLDGEFERLWLAVPAGLVSLADAEGCPEPLGDEARAHASYFAVRHGAREKIRILARAFARALGGGLTTIPAPPSPP